MKPHAAQLRQQQALQRRARLQDSLAKVNVDPATASRYQQVKPRTRGQHVITQAEWDEMVEHHEDSGKTFRYAFLVVVLLVCLLLLGGKYDSEYGLDLPQVGGKSRELKGPMSDAELLAKHFDILGVDQHFTSRQQEEREEEDRERRLENYRVKQQVKSAYERHLESQNQLVYCGRSCTQKNDAVQLAYDKLMSQVDRELFGFLLDADDVKAALGTSKADIKKRYEEKVAAVEGSNFSEEVRHMELEELRDAYEIIQDADSRKYYLLYGEKPPEVMKHTSARHGGWGQEMALGTYKYKIIIMWLDYVHQYIGLWGETVVLLALIVGLCLKMPEALEQSMRIVDEMDWGDEDEAEPKDGK